MMQIRCVSEYFFASSYQRRGTWDHLICKIFAARLGGNLCHLFGDTRLTAADKVFIRGCHYMVQIDQWMPSMCSMSSLYHFHPTLTISLAIVGL
jgi:hypothetical protein